MTDVDISPEAVETVCDSLRRALIFRIPAGEIATLRALSAALQQSQAETAVVIERAAQILDERHCIHMTAKGRNPDNYVSGWSLSAYAIRALATPDQTAALDAVVAKAEADGMRKAVSIAIGRKGVGADSMPHPYDAGYLAACDDIAAMIKEAIPKGGA